MIARTWTAHTSPDRRTEYLTTVRQVLLPHLRAVPAYVGSHFLCRSVDDRLEIMALTYWESMEAVRALAGDPPMSAYVPPKVAATLQRFDDEAVHYEVMIEDSLSG